MKITVHARNGDYSFDCRPGERLLYAGLRGGLCLPYECGTGTCGTCRAQRTGDDIDELWSAAPGRANLKAERGEFLMCQSAARHACAVKIRGKLQAPSDDTIVPVYGRGTMGGIKRLTQDVISFAIHLDESMNFHPGQFVGVEAPAIDGFRAYSMVNCERDAKRLDFVVKKKPDGAFSRWLFGDGAEGTEVSLFGPLGRAVLYSGEQKNVLCIAGGSGIAGIMSILTRACEAGYFERHDGHVFFGIRTMADAFFFDELAAFVAASTKLQVTIALSDEDAPAPEATGHPQFNYATGFVHTVASERMANQYDSTVAFVAGPPPMADAALRMLIIEARLPAADIRYDKFG